MFDHNFVPDLFGELRGLYSAICLEAWEAPGDLVYLSWTNSDRSQTNCVTSGDNQEAPGHISGFHNKRAEYYLTFFPKQSSFWSFELFHELFRNRSWFGNSGKIRKQKGLLPQSCRQTKELFPDSTTWEQIFLLQELLLRTNSCILTWDESGNSLMRPAELQKSYLENWRHQILHTFHKKEIGRVFMGEAENDRTFLFLFIFHQKKKKRILI